MPDYECPRCGQATKVKRTEKSASLVRRTRVCEGNHTTVTHEAVPDTGLMVERRSGSVEPLNRKWALERSIKVAGAGNLTSEFISRIADDVLRRLAPDASAPLSTERIGDQVLQELALRAPSAAMRYATTFLTSRGRVSTPDELAQWMVEHIPAVRRVEAERRERKEAPRPRPRWVVKRGRPDLPAGWGEEFSLQKLVRGLRTSTRGLTPDAWKRSYSSEDAHDFFVGTLAAWILAEAAGQVVVTSGQLSAASLRVLRSECPLGYLRFAVVAKKLDGIEMFLEECRGLTASPSAPVGLEACRGEGQQLAREVRAIESAVRQRGEA